LPRTRSGLAAFSRLPLRYALAGVLLAACGLTLLLSSGCFSGSTEVPPATTVITLAPSPTPTPTEPPNRIVNTSLPARLVIESIGVNAPVMELGLDSRRAPEVPDYTNSSSPRSVVAWYDFGALPGQGSNAIFAGHVTFDGVGVFYYLDSVSPGDTVKVITQDGKTLVYQVFDTLVVDPSRADLLNPTNDDILTVITCGGGTFIPVPGEAFGGHYPGRVVLRAKLSQVV